MMKTKALIFAGVLLFGGNAFADEAPPGRSIGYAFYSIDYGLYQTADTKEECPNGLAKEGPREQFKALYPEDAKRTVIGTQLAYESDVWFPKAQPDQFAFPEAAGTKAIGLDLDGKAKPGDFTSPDGKSGVDNQLFRVIGCIGHYRTGGSLQHIGLTFLQKNIIDRLLIELTDVDSLVNDDDVTLTTYHGLNALMNDATGENFYPGGTQAIDLRWGKEYIHSAKAKIVNGVLMTEPMDFVYPTELAYEDASLDVVKNARIEMKLTPERAEAVIAGYFDVETFYRNRARQWGTLHHNYGQEALASVYRQLRKHADAYPDAKTGQNTAISGAYIGKLVQVHMLHPEKSVSELAVTHHQSADAAK